jgi:hypothetical protein
MKNRYGVYVMTLSIWILLSGLLMAGCAINRNPRADTGNQALTSISQIESFNTDVACQQALEVINNNPYDQEFFEQVFAKVVEQCRNSKSPSNADIIWEHLVMPLKKSGKVPPDLASTLWNYYFSRQFVSLPKTASMIHYCHRLPEIKEAIEKEYQLKKIGFEVCQQGSADGQFLNAMYVYNTMWAACHDVEEK